MTLLFFLFVLVTSQASILAWDAVTSLSCVVLTGCLGQSVLAKESPMGVQLPYLADRLHTLSSVRVCEAGQILDACFHKFGVDWMEKAVQDLATVEVSAVYLKLLTHKFQPPLVDAFDPALW